MVSRKKQLALQRAIQAQRLYGGQFDMVGPGQEPGMAYIRPPDRHTLQSSKPQELVDVVIPARNEQETVGDVVNAFRHARGIGRIIVVNDRSTDNTAECAGKAEALVITGPGQGKGQAIKAGLSYVETNRVIFTDSDLYGFSPSHAEALAQPRPGQIVGMCDNRTIGNVINIANLPPISGMRSLPTGIARMLPLDGYGMEYQINGAMVRFGLPSWHFIMRSVRGKVRAGPLRMLDVLPYMNEVSIGKYAQSVTWLDPVPARWPT